VKQRFFHETQANMLRIAIFLCYNQVADQSLERMLLMKRRSKVMMAAVALLLFLAIGLAYLFAVVLPQKRTQEQTLKALQAYYDAKIATYPTENEKYEDYEVDVVFLGDSLTDGYDLNSYYPQYLTLNRGIGGDTTFGLEKRLQISVYDLKPKVAVMLIGANNLDTMFENYENILKGFQQNLPETKVVLLSLTAMGGDIWGSKNQLAAYNNVSIKLLAQKYGFTFVDLYAPLYDVSRGEVYDGYTTDGGHLTHEGYTVITAQITPVLEELLGR
jgi:lysophospholipase L1-like esterase